MVSLIRTEWLCEVVIKRVIEPGTLYLYIPLTKFGLSNKNARGFAIFHLNMWCCSLGIFVCVQTTLFIMNVICLHYWWAVIVFSNGWAPTSKNLLPRPELSQHFTSVRWKYPIVPYETKIGRSYFLFKTSVVFSICCDRECRWETIVL